MISLSKSSSVITLWVQEPSFSNSSGTISFEGIVPNPGFTGSGKVLTATFKVLKQGSARVSFANASVLANDGNGTEIGNGGTDASYSLIASTVETPPQNVKPQNVKTPVTKQSEPNAAPLSNAVVIQSSTHPDQTHWYNATEATFEWENPTDVISVRLGAGTDAQGVPHTIYKPPSSQKIVSFGEGTSYFYQQVQTKAGLSAVARYKVQIDTTSPKPFSVVVAQGTAPSQSAATFSTTDALSGIDHYEVVVNDRIALTLTPEDVQKPVTLPPASRGTTRLRVFAYDKAGNVAYAETTYTSFGAPIEIQSPFFINNYLLLLLTGLLVVALILSVIRSLYLQWKLKQVRTAIAEEIEALNDIKKERDLTAEEKRIMKKLW